MWINPIAPPPKIDLEQSTSRIMTHVRARLNHPCAYCKGKGTIELNDEDWLTCPDCLGTGIDINKARAT
jgi:DnaJ-class molecular chaperone